MYGTLKKGPRYLEMAEGYVTGIALDEDNEIIGYQFVSLGKMTDFIKKVMTRTQHGKKQKVSTAVLQMLLRSSTHVKNNYTDYNFRRISKWLYLNHMRDELTKSIQF